jgi:hypothetical protein
MVNGGSHGLFGTELRMVITKSFQDDPGMQTELRISTEE